MGRTVHRSAVAGLALAAGMSAASATELLREADGPKAPAAAAGKPFLQVSAPCGSKGDSFFCGQIRMAKPNPAPLALPAYRVAYPGAGRALVTWQGQVYCKATTDEFAFPNYQMMQYYLHFSMRGTGAPDYNAPGAASVGEYLSESDTGKPPFTYRDVIWPVTVSMYVSVPAAQVRTHQMTVFPDFRYFNGSQQAFCNINGGGYTVQYFPN